MSREKKIAVIGSGISGLGAAWLLSKKYQVTLFEQNDYVGGHSNTRPAVFGDETVWADTGFMVFNYETYPNLVKLFEHLGVAVKKTDMSFGVTLHGGLFEFVSNNIFVQKKNIFESSFWTLLFDILRFNNKASDIVNTFPNDFSLRDLLAELKLSERFTEQYLLPMSGAIWSTDKKNVLDYPAKQFVSFCENHGLLNPRTLNPFKLWRGRLQWYTVEGGSILYVERILKDMDVEVLLNTGVSEISRIDGGVTISTVTGEAREFDEVVCAAHPNQTLLMLADATAAEQSLLGAFKYSQNHTVMHKDTSYMMKGTKNWPSWTYAEPAKDYAELSYYMNSLQHIDPKFPVVVTLNPSKTIKADDIFYQTDYEHPMFTAQTQQAQIEIENIQGKNKIYYVGAWLGNGFHEDGLRSAVAVANKLDIKAPWQ